MELINPFALFLFWCYNYRITLRTKWEAKMMVVTIDFNSDEALYIQLRNQIIVGIATARIHEGESLPSVRQLADNIGINMHTVNKAYTILKQEGYITLDRRRGAVISLDVDKMNAMNNLIKDMRVIIAQAMCKNISSEEIHSIVDDIIDEFSK